MAKALFAVAACVLALVALSAIVLQNSAQEPTELLIGADLSALKVSLREAKREDAAAKAAIREIDEEDKKEQVKKAAASEKESLAKAEKEASAAVDRDLAALKRKAARLSPKKKAVTKPKNASSKKNNLAAAEHAVSIAKAQVKIADKAENVVKRKVFGEAKKAEFAAVAAKEKIEAAGMYRKSAAYLKQKSKDLEAKAVKLATKLHDLEKKEASRMRSAQDIILKERNSQLREEKAKETLKALESKAAAIRSAEKAAKEKAQNLDNAIIHEHEVEDAKHEKFVRAKVGVDDASSKINEEKNQILEKEHEAYQEDVASNPLYSQV